MEDAVCAVQTKLLQPNGSTDSHLFCGGTLSGEIVFDGIDIETTSEKNFYNRLLDVNDMQTATVSLIDCTLRCMIFSQKAKNIFVQNSDLYIASLEADTIKANNSRFYAQKSNWYAHLYASGEYENCYFSPLKQDQHYSLWMGDDRDQTISVKKCFFENGRYAGTAMLHAEECYFALNSSPTFSSIKDCFIKGNTIDCQLNIDIENSYIISTDWHAFTDAYSRSVPAKFSIKNSIVDNKKADGTMDFIRHNNKNKVVIEMENSKITGFETFWSNNYHSHVEITMTNCSYYNEVECIYPFLNLVSDKSQAISIENCNFDLKNNSFIYASACDTSWSKNDYDVITDGFLKIKHNSFKLKENSSKFYQENFHVYLSRNIEFTDNIIERETSLLINLVSSDSVKFTGNKCYGQRTDIKATNVAEFADNKYDNFVMYDISVGNNKQLDLSSEIIDIKEPLYCADNTTCTKQAYLSLSNGEIDIDKRYKDFFLCGLELKNATAFVKGQNFGKMPSFLNKDVPVEVSGSDSILELIGCTVEGNDFWGAIKADGSLTVNNSEIKGSIGEKKWDSLLNIELKNGSKVTSIDNDYYTSHVSGRNITVSEKSSAEDIDADETVTVSGGSTVGNISANNITIKNSTAGKIGTSWYKDAVVSCSESTVESIQSWYGTVTLKRCTFNGSKRRDSAVKIGGAEYSEDKYTATELIIDNCSFSNYILDCPGSFGAGAAVCAKAANVQITNNCSFTNCTNKCDDDGGAIYIRGANTVSIDRTSFTSNTAENWRGGAVHIDAKDVKLSNCTFSGNKALETNAKKTGGGAVAIECRQDNVKAVISNCTFTNNSCTVANRGTDIWMSAIFTEENSDKIAEEHSGCTLEISGCNIDLSSNSVLTNNINK